MTRLRPRNRQFWLLQAGGWLFFLIASLAYYQVRGTLTAAIVERYATAAAAGFLATLLLRLLYKALDIKSRPVLALSLAAIALSLLGANIVVWVADLLKLPFSGLAAWSASRNWMSYLSRVIWWMSPLVGWSALYFGIDYWQQWRVQKERTEKAKALAQSAQLQMLRYRLSPHFLFNALNSIRALIADDKTSAKSMVTELSEFLRYSLVSKNYKNVPLKDEMESIRHYFNIQKMRYENKLQVSLEVDPAAEDWPIAGFLLYPLAENAVTYGLCTSTLPLQIQIKAGVEAGRLRVEIANSGSWIKDPAPEPDPELGRGLDNVRRRLAESYPSRHRLDILEGEGWVRVRLDIEPDSRR